MEIQLDSKEWKECKLSAIVFPFLLNVDQADFKRKTTNGLVHEIDSRPETRINHPKNSSLHIVYHLEEREIEGAKGIGWNKEEALKSLKKARYALRGILTGRKFNF